MGYVSDPPLTKLKSFTANLAQAAATYTLATANVDTIILAYAIYSPSTATVLTSVQIKTNQTNSVDIMSAAEGVVASLLAQKNVTIARTQPILLKAGQLLQYVIVGATGTGSLECNFTYIGDLS